MKILLVAVNSKYIHTSLAVRSLSANSGGTEFLEFTINENIQHVTDEIYRNKPDAVCFSCYIWNIEYILKLSSVLKKMMPKALIVLGGPEVTFCANDILKEYNFVDAVVRGEGEIVFANLVKHSFDFKMINGVTWRNPGDILSNPDEALVCNLDELIFPYTDDDLEKNRGKLIYYESSRGCPYKCSYCLSSTEHSVRFKSVEKVIGELKKIIEYKPDTVKFVDRTFNADRKRTVEILKFIKNNSRGITFHFEIEAGILNDEFMELISDSPEGMFRFEIGLQSTNPETLSAINRNENVKNLLANTEKILKNKNNIVHLDLIAGLPYESYELFRKSFNDAISVRPNELQLGFLKLLKGTAIRNRSDDYGYKYSDFPPYEVIENNYISCGELMKLRNIEDVFDKFYNSGGFENACVFMEGFFGDSFLFYERLAEWFCRKEYYGMQFSRGQLYEILFEFAKSQQVDELFFDVLKYDFFLSNGNASTPSWSLYEYDESIHKHRVEIIESNPELFSAFDGMSVKEILKRTHFEKFRYRVHDNCDENDCILVFTKNKQFLGEIIFKQ